MNDKKYSNFGLVIACFFCVYAKILVILPKNYQFEKLNKSNLQNATNQTFTAKNENILYKKLINTFALLV